MNSRITEEFALIVNVIKWLVLATGVGLAVGLSTTFFLKVLHLITDGVSLVPYSLLLLPLGLCASAWITSSLAPEAGGQGVERVIQAVHLRSGRIQAEVIPARFVATLLTIGVGGSAGNVGPCAQIGGGFASWLADILRFSDAERKTFVICGISAGFAAVLGTPIAGAFFGVEALFVGGLAYQVLLPSVTAAIVAHQVTKYFGIIFWTTPLDIAPALSTTLLPWAILAGLIFGLSSVLLIEGITLGRRVSGQVKLPLPAQGLLAGFALLGIAAISSDQLLGLGEGVVQQAIAGQEILWYLFFLKIVFTSLTLNFGGSGGVIMPICFVGATVGATFGNLFELDSGLFAAIGVSALLAGAVNTPITAVLLALELFGVQIGIYALMACVISFLISGHRSAIPTQLLKLHKAPAIRTELNQEISAAQFTVEPWDFKMKIVKLRKRLSRRHD